MLINVVHIVDNLGKVNFGIWNAAIFASEYLKDKYSINSLLCVCQDNFIESPSLGIPTLFLGTGNNMLKKLLTQIETYNYSYESTVIVTHGCWSMPTKLGYKLKRKGFKWIYTPHGMLEPWSMKQKRLKKIIYFLLVEKNQASKADSIRAVSQIEKQNLEKVFTRPVVKIENGISITSPFHPKSIHETVFLFMARLHYKKGILPLVQAWSSTMKKVDHKVLLIAGPDEGELKKIQPYLGDSIQYVGAIYGDKKREILRRAHYYILPSYSEGFPTSVVEAMGFGLIPFISSGCNFPEVFSKQLGYLIEPEKSSIEIALRSVKQKDYDQELSKKNFQFIVDNYSESKIGENLKKLYLTLLKYSDSGVNF